MRGSLIASVVLTATLVGGPGRAGPPDSARVENLGRRLEGDRSFKIRVLAAKKLGALSAGPARRDPAALRALRIGLEDPEGIVRGMCARALAAHEDRGALAALEQLGRHDPDRSVRREARRAMSKIRSAPRQPARPSQPKLHISLGKVSVIGGDGASPSAPGLQARLHGLVADRIGPHRAPGEAQLRMDVQVERRTAVGREVRYEVRVVLLELPKSHLRHTAKAVARADAKPGAAHALEERVALEAVSRAVEDALATAVAAN